MTIDDTAPEVLNQFTLNDDLIFREEDKHVLLPLEIKENEYVAAVFFLTEDGSIMGKYEIENTPGTAETFYFDITGYGSDFTILVADYACNENEFDVSLDLGDYTDAVPTMSELSKDRIYGCETFSGAVIDSGWFSVNKADFSDLRNETFDASKRYYSGEYVNGYVIAQNANTGHLELLTPTNTYWKTQTIAENNGSVGDYGVWVLYDMALDYSGTLSTALEQRYSDDEAADSLLGVGWYYMGDQDNNGKDDGYNALFMVKFSDWGNYVEAIARIVGTEDNAEILTFAINDNGEMYGISTDGKLYSLAANREYDNDLGSYVVRATYIGTTDFVNYSGYGGVNVIQSMAFDHNTGKLYWFAHSQVSAGYYYVTYEVDPATAKCTVLGTYGAGGQTAMFIPNDLESDLFTLGVTPKRFTLSPDSVVLAQTQTKRLTVSWQPWNASASQITWKSDDDSIATVDEFGKITAVGEGKTTISGTAECMLDGYWDTSGGNWSWVEGGPGEYTASCTVTVVPSQSEIYGFIIEDFSTTEADLKWISYSDTQTGDITDLGQSLVPTTDADGNETMTAAMWSGGAYYNGYVYTVLEEQRETNGTIAVGTGLYKSKVTKTDEGTTIGQPEFIGFQQNMTISAMGFDYNTSRMYCTENKYIGGIGIIDLDTGLVDMLGQPKGDLSGAVYIPALCVTADGTIVISDAVANLYTINPDTLETEQIYTGSGDSNSAYYEAMHYDYDTGNIYWNMCDGSGASPLYLVRMPEYAGQDATVVDLGGVSSKKGTQQTVIFTLPENEPEAKLLPVESIAITNGDSITGLLGGSAQLETVTVPARPTVRTRTWTSTNEDVVTVDRNGLLTYVGLGEAIVKVSITNKDEATYGGPFTAEIKVTVKEAAGEFVAFLNADEDGGSQYYDFWLRGNDYDLRHTEVEDSMIAVYSLRAGTYYDGYYYAFNNKGSFLRINPADPSDYKIIGATNLNYTNYQVTAVAMDYTTGTMYGLTLPSQYNYSTWSSEKHPGELVKVDLDTGYLTTVAELDFNNPVFALACDANGQLYAAGGSFDISDANKLFKLNKETGELTQYMNMGGAKVYTGGTYYGTAYYNAQMTYDFGTDRLYLYATARGQYTSESYGMYMIELGETPAISYLDGISLQLRGDIKYGKVYLGMLAFVPEKDEVPVGEVNGINLDKTVARLEVGGTAQITGVARPSNAADPSITWTSTNEDVAIVDETGLVTGISVGTATIVATSNQTGVTAKCAVSVVSLDGPQSVAYTVSANKDALVSFNPALPAQTAKTVSTLSGGATIKGMAYGEDCLYYLMMSGWSYYLYRYDLVSNQSSLLGQIYLFTEPTGMAYAPAPEVYNETTGEYEKKGSDMFYVTAGFYLFQFEMDKLDATMFNYYTNYVMDPDYCKLAGVACVDGKIYTMGNGFYNSVPFVRMYEDKYLQTQSVVVDVLEDLLVVDGVTDFAYDSSSGLFYAADASSILHTFDLNDVYTNDAGKKALPTNVVDVVGDGTYDVNGLAIKPAN